MNIYRLTFHARCPTNGVRIEYALEVENPATANPLLVEDLIDAVSLLDKGFHEEFADTLWREFGGKQVLRADHHGVAIETRRGFT